MSLQTGSTLYLSTAHIDIYSIYIYIYIYIHTHTHMYIRYVSVKYMSLGLQRNTAYDTYCMCLQ